MDISLPETLGPLVEAIVAIANLGLSDGTVIPDERLWIHMEASKFENTEDGPDVGARSGTQVSKPDWLHAIQRLQVRVKADPIYDKSLDALKTQFPGHDSVIEGYLAKFVWRVLVIIVSDGTDDAHALEFKSVCSRFLNDLADGPVTFLARVNLNGLVLAVPSVQVAVGITLRQPTREDIEIDTPSGWPVFGPSSIAQIPQAIAEIQHTGSRDQHVDVQRKVHHLISMLRLFGVGSVTYTTYELESDSVIGFFGGRAAFGSGVAPTARERYIVRLQDVPRLKTFWAGVSHALPTDIYDFQKQITPITLAYDRYSDAVLYNGIVERRVANAVMGLEALLLVEQQELSYRLGLRIAKALSLLGKNPLDVRRRIRHAYTIRSLFAHGGHLSAKEKGKLETKYGSMKAFVVPLFDCLRTLIIVMIMLHRDKEEVTNLLDDALIAPERHEALRQLLSPLESLVSGPSQ